MSSAPGKRVLVAEDETYLRHLLASRLHRAGFEVITASDGLRAWQLVRQRHPDLVISDDQMPVLSGLELAVRLRRTPQTCHIPMILLSGLGLGQGASSGTAGFSAVLSKPFTTGELLKRVDQLFSRPLDPGGRSKAPQTQLVTHCGGAEAGSRLPRLLGESSD